MPRTTRHNPITAEELADALGGKRSGDGWKAPCPAHDDQHASLSISDKDGKPLWKCHAGCEQDQVLDALRRQGLWPEAGGRRSTPPENDSYRRSTRPDLALIQGSRDTKGNESPTRNPLVTHSQPAHRPGLTLEQYAEAKQLPLSFLRELGLSNMTYDRGPAVRIPYLDTAGKEPTARYRLRLEKGEHEDGRFKWKKDAKTCLYGLWRVQRARAVGHVVLVEGESDCHTLWHHDIPALGVPGANNWNETRDVPALEGIGTIYVVWEPDQGGEAVLRWVEKSGIRDRVHLVSLGAYKDSSSLYLDDPDRFRERWQEAIKAAERWTSREQVARKAARDRAYEQAKELLTSTTLVDRITGAMRAQGYAGNVDPALTVYLALTSRLLTRPINLALVAASSAGKNRTIDAALRLMPPEAFYKTSASSERALVYSGESFAHRVVVVEEADSIPEEGPAASAIRAIADSTR